MAISLPWGYFLTVGIWVVVHFQGHNFSFSAVFGAAQEFWAIGAGFSRFSSWVGSPF